jgi:hypothetical protein
MLKKFKKHLLNEINLARMYQYTQEKSIGMISASRGKKDTETAEEAKRRNEFNTKALANDIRSAGFGFVPVAGYYIEDDGKGNKRPVAEKSFLIAANPESTGKLKDFLFKAGKKYDQDSVLFKSYNSDTAVLLGTASGRYPGLGVEVVIGKWKANAIGDYYTKMKNHRSFTFESVDFAGKESATYYSRMMLDRLGLPSKNIYSAKKTIADYICEALKDNYGDDDAVYKKRK